MSNQPRFEVIVEAPFLTWGKGTILIPAEDGEMYSKEHGYSPSKLKLYLKDMDKFPSVFRKMNWWEGLKIDDSPRFVKCGIVVRRFKEYRSKTENIVLFDNPGEIEYIDSVKHMDGKGYELYYAGDCEPATEQEYNSYLKKSKKK